MHYGESLIVKGLCTALNAKDCADVIEILNFYRYRNAIVINNELHGYSFDIFTNISIINTIADYTFIFNDSEMQIKTVEFVWSILDAFPDLVNKKIEPIQEDIDVSKLKLDIHNSTTEETIFNIDEISSDSLAGLIYLMLIGDKDVTWHNIGEAKTINLKFSAQQ